MIFIIGSGPAGISAALYLKRSNLPVTIITNHKSVLMKAASIENYYGTGQISGADLYASGIDSAINLDIPIIEDEVLNISEEEDFIITGSKSAYNADCIILATGTSRKKEVIPNAELFEGKGVSYCATCDGYFFKKKKIAVIGNGEYANHEHEYLQNITNDISLYSIEEIKEIIGNEKIEHIVLKDDTRVPIDGIFIALDYPDSSILAKKLGILQNNRYIIVDDDMQTNIPGILACGDVTGSKQIASAVYQGMVAATSASKYYKQKHD